MAGTSGQEAPATLYGPEIAGAGHSPKRPIVARTAKAPALRAGGFRCSMTVGVRTRTSETAEDRLAPIIGRQLQRSRWS